MRDSQADPSYSVMATEILEDPGLGDPEQLSAAQPLWRYMKLSTLLLLILKGQAFFPSIATLQNSDPLEGILYVEPPWLFNRLDELAKGSADDTLFSWLKEHESKFWEQAVLPPGNGVNAGPFYLNDQLSADRYVRALAKRRAVWCWFNSNIESAGMWSIYGHNGIAIGTTIGALKRALPTDYEFQIARVRYASRESDAFGHIDPENRCNAHLIHRPHLVKGREYGHEREVRVVTHCEGDEKGALIERINYATLVQEVIISPLLPVQEADAIKQCLDTQQWEKRPYVRDSSLLGDIPDKQRSAIEIGRNWRQSFGSELNQLGFPRLLKKL